MKLLVWLLLLMGHLVYHAEGISDKEEVPSYLPERYSLPPLSERSPSSLSIQIGVYLLQQLERIDNFLKEDLDETS